MFWWMFPVGLMLMTAGVVTALRPAIITYAAEKCNKRTAEFLARLGFRHFLDTWPAEVRRMRIFIPIGLFVIGLGWCIFAIQSL